MSITGSKVAELLKQKKVKMDNNGKVLKHVETNEVIANLVTSKDGVNYYKAVGDQTKGQEICLEWQWDDVLKIKICVSFG